MGKIILKCVTEKRKLRIKFHCYINDEGKEYRNVYNNKYNCRFPKDIRRENRYFEIDESDLKTMVNGTPFYTVKKTNIKILDDYDINNDDTYDIKNEIENMKIYSVEECVICLCETPSSIFIPCGHQVCCKDCTEMLYKKGNNKCPICRGNICNTYQEA